MACNSNLSFYNKVLGFLTKKIRNLDKRKAKLDSYKQRMDAGEELVQDIKDAVHKLPEVQICLEFSKNLQEAVTQIYTEDQAAMVAAQYDRDVERIYQLLDLQSTMRKVSEGIKIDFFGDPSDMERVSQFVDLITPDPDDIPPNEQLREASRHIVNFLDGSPEPVMETTCILCRDPYYFCGKLVSLSRNYICPSCLNVYNPEHLDVQEIESEAYDKLMTIEDVWPFGAYDEGRIGDVTINVPDLCKTCRNTIYINVVVTAEAVYTDYDHEYKMPSIDYFEEIELKRVLKADTKEKLTSSLMEVFEFFDYDEDFEDYLPHLEEYELTEEELKLLMIVKTRMNNGYCYIGWDIDNKALIRPVLRTATNMCCWTTTDPELQVGEQYRFQVRARYLSEIPFPHKSNDVQVDFSGHLPAGNLSLFDILVENSCQRVEDVFMGAANIKERRYIPENTECSSAGIYRCSGKNVEVSVMTRKDGKIRKRCMVKEGEVSFTFPFTSLEPYHPTSNGDVLVILGLARPFKGYEGEYSPLRCCILVLGIIAQSTSTNQEAAGQQAE